MKFSSLPYIVYPQQVSKLVQVTNKKFGDFFFIRKKEEQSYNSYRKVEKVAGNPYFVQVRLPAEVFNEQIKSGLMDRKMA